jgi:hypothetical protein
MMMGGGMVPSIPPNPLGSEGIDLNFLPPGLTPSDYANMPPEHQFLVEQQMMQAQQQA